MPDKSARVTRWARVPGVAHHCTKRCISIKALRNSKLQCLFMAKETRNKKYSRIRLIRFRLVRQFA